MTLQIRDPIHGDDASPLSRFLSVPFKIGQPKRLNRRLGMMKKCLKNTWFPRVGLLVFLLMFFSLTPPGICQDGNTAEQIETIESALVKDKGDYGILIDGRQYRVTESTIIFDLLGKEIPLCDLSVPCEARVEYKRIKEMDPACLRVEMQRLLEDSKEKK